MAMAAAPRVRFGALPRVHNKTASRLTLIATKAECEHSEKVRVTPGCRHVISLTEPSQENVGGWSAMQAGWVKSLWRDPWWWLAVCVALLFWALLYALRQPSLDLAWPLSSPWSFLLPVILLPVLEEVVFRGLLQEWLAQRLRPWQFGFLTSANIVTSLVFAGMHGFYHPPLWAVAVVLPSLVFGYFKERYRSLGPPILLHGFYNFGYFWLFAVP